MKTGNYARTSVYCMRCDMATRDRGLCIFQGDWIGIRLKNGQQCSNLEVKSIGDTLKVTTVAGRPVEVNYDDIDLVVLERRGEKATHIFYGHTQNRLQGSN